MKERILLLRYNLAFIYKNYRLYRLKHVQNKWIFSRVACLGKDVIKVLQIDLPIFNLQKGRSDYIVDSLLDSLIENEEFNKKQLKFKLEWKRNKVNVKLI